MKANLQITILSKVLAQFAKDLRTHPYHTPHARVDEQFEKALTTPIV